MKTRHQTSLGITLAIAVLLGIVWQFYPLPDAQLRLNSLPLKGVHFNGYEVPITPMEQTFFKGVNMLKRIYQIGDQRAFIYVLDGTHNRHAVHDPTYCFRGGGWEIVSEKTYPIKGGTAKLFQLLKTDSGQRREALLWFSDGKKHYDSPLHYWLQATLRRLTLGYSGPEPILVVIQPIDTPTLDWEKILEEFPELLNI